MLQNLVPFEAHDETSISRKIHSSRYQVVVACFEKLVNPDQQDLQQSFFLPPVIEVVYSHFRSKLLGTDQPKSRLYFAIFFLHIIHLYDNYK